MPEDDAGGRHDHSEERHLPFSGMACRAVDPMPGLVLLSVGMFVLAGWRRMADCFTEMQRRDKLSACRDAALFRRVDTVLVGLFLIGAGSANLLEWS